MKIAGKHFKQRSIYKTMEFTMNSVSVFGKKAKIILLHSRAIRVHRLACNLM
jgi:hypothetical protein